MISLPTHSRRVLLIGLLLFAAVPGVVAAQTTEDGNSTTGDEPESETDLNGVIEAVEGLRSDIEGLTGGVSLKDIILDTIFGPFREFGQRLLEESTVVLTTTPDVHPNPAVEEIHRQTLMVAYLLSSLAFMATGILYMVGPILGISYAQVRKTLPRVVIALVFSTLSLPLLQLSLDLGDALTQAFRPDLVSKSIGQMMGLRIAAVLVWVINATLLLALLAIFLLRDVYLLFVAAISPLLAIGWSLPRAKQYADKFIGGWWAALLLGPLDMLVLRLSITLLRGNGMTSLQSVSNWLYGVAVLVLLLLIPLQLWGASQAAVSQANALTRGVKKRVRKHRRKSRRNRRRKHRREYWQRQEKKMDEYRERRLEYLKRRGERYRGDD